MSCCSKLCLFPNLFWPNFLSAEPYNSASTMSSKVTWAVFPLLSGSPGNRIYPVRPGPPHPLLLLLLPHLPLHLIQLLLPLPLLLHLLLLPLLLFLLLLLLQLHLLLPLQRQDSTLKQRYSFNRALNSMKNIILTHNTFSNTYHYYRYNYHHAYLVYDHSNYV